MDTEMCCLGAPAAGSAGSTNSQLTAPLGLPPKEQPHQRSHTVPEHPHLMTEVEVWRLAHWGPTQDSPHGSFWVACEVGRCCCGACIVPRFPPPNLASLPSLPWVLIPGCFLMYILCPKLCLHICFLDDTTCNTWTHMPKSLEQPDRH